MKVMGGLSRDDLKKVCGDNFPEWISFPVFEQVEWLYLFQFPPFISLTLVLMTPSSLFFPFVALTLVLMLLSSFTLQWVLKLNCSLKCE